MARYRRSYRYPSGQIVTYERGEVDTSDPLRRMGLVSAQIIGTDPGHGPSARVGWIEPDWYAVDGTGSPVSPFTARALAGELPAKELAR